MAEQAPKETITALERSPTTQPLTRPALGLPTPEEIKVIEYLGQTYHQSGLLPAGVKNWQAAVIAIQAGRELGIPPTVAIREVYVVHGRPTCSAQLMMALIRRDRGPDAIRVANATPTGCTIEYREPGWGGVNTFTFDESDAKRAGLAGGSNVNWNKYPRAMYRSRAISEVARMAFPDSILGFYTPEELGAPVDAEGRIVVTGTVIDHDTGEITDGKDEDRERLIAAIHAQGKERGWEHEHLSFLLKAATDGQGFTEASTQQISDLKDWLTTGNGNVERRLEQVKAALADQQTPEQHDDLVNDPELQAAADAVQTGR